MRRFVPLVGRTGRSRADITDSETLFFYYRSGYLAVKIKSRRESKRDTLRLQYSGIKVYNVFVMSRIIVSVISYQRLTRLLSDKSRDKGVAVSIYHLLSVIIRSADCSRKKNTGKHSAVISAGSRRHGRRNIHRLPYRTP